MPSHQSQFRGDEASQRSIAERWGADAIGLVPSSAAVPLQSWSVPPRVVPIDHRGQSFVFVDGTPLC